MLFDVAEVHDDRRVEDAIDEVYHEYLDLLLDLTGDTFMGFSTIELELIPAWSSVRGGGGGRGPRRRTDRRLAVQHRATAAAQGRCSRTPRERQPRGVRR